MTTTRFFSWQDTGAPVLTGNNQGALINIIQSCLVGDSSGVAYGSGANEKQAAGWTKPFSGVNKTVLRNSTTMGGTGCYVRMEETSATLGTIETFRSMSDVDTGTGGTTPYYTMTSNYYDSSSATLEWYLWADELTFYFASDGGSGLNGTVTSPYILGAGDIDSLIVNDDVRYFCAGRTENGTTNGSSSSRNPAVGLTYNYGQQNFETLRLGGGYDNASAPTKAGLVQWTNTVGGGLRATIGGNGSPARGSTGGAGLMLIPAHVVHDGGFRGFLRGVKVPLNAITDLDNGSLLGGVDGLSAGSQLRVAKHSTEADYASNVGGLLIESALSW